MIVRRNFHLCDHLCDMRHSGWLFHACSPTALSQPTTPCQSATTSSYRPFFPTHKKYSHNSSVTIVDCLSCFLSYILFLCFPVLEFGWLEMYVYSYQRGKKHHNIFFVCYNNKTRETCNKRPSVAWVMPYWTIFSDINKDKISYFRHGFKKNKTKKTITAAFMMEHNSRDILQ